MLLLTLLSLLMMGSITHGDAMQSTLATPVLAPCNQQWIDVVKGLWQVTGQPKDVLKKMEGQNYIGTFTTYHDMAGVKCFRSNFSDSSWNVIFYYTNQCRPGVLNFKVEEYPGYLKLNGGSIVVYMIQLDDNLMAHYGCSPDSTEKRDPLIALYVNAKVVDNPLTRYISKVTTSVLTGLLGKNIASVFTSLDECIFG